MKKISFVFICICGIIFSFSVPAKAGTAGKLNTLIILESIGLADRAGIIDMRGITRSIFPVYPAPAYSTMPVVPVQQAPVQKQILQPVNCEDSYRYPTSEERNACRQGQAERIRRIKQERIRRAREEGYAGYTRY